MKTLFPLLFLLVLSEAFSADALPHLELYVPDGQIRSHLFRVLVTSNITEGMKPRLELHASHIVTESNESQTRLRHAAPVAPGQTWMSTIDGSPRTLYGTLLLFNIDDYDIPFWKPVIRLTPILRWDEADGNASVTRTLIGNQDIYLGNLPIAIAWTTVLILFLAFVIGYWAKSKTGEARYLLCGPDRYFSLWRTQLATWTLAVGAMVFCFGLIRLEVPQIPDSLVALMGLSLLTGTVSAAKTKSDSQVKLTPQNNPIDESSLAVPATPRTPVVPKKLLVNPNPPAFGDLISDYSEELGRVVLSIPKAQMLFWTVIVLILFVGKTVVNGVLWEVPWEMVALTGFSQAGYIGDKFIKSS
jgi:hypothetical protein